MLQAVLGAMESLKDLGLDEMVGMRLQGRRREQLWRRSPRLPRLERASLPSRGQEARRRVTEHEPALHPRHLADSHTHT